MIDSIPNDVDLSKPVPRLTVKQARTGVELLQFLVKLTDDDETTLDYLDVLSQRVNNLKYNIDLMIREAKKNATA